jgi:hypothetical protein
MSKSFCWLATAENGEIIGTPAILPDDLINQLLESGNALCMENGEEVLFYEGEYLVPFHDGYDHYFDFEEGIKPEKIKAITDAFHVIGDEAKAFKASSNADTAEFVEWNDCYQTVKASYGDFSQFAEHFQEKLGKVCAVATVDWGFKDDDSRYAEESYSHYTYTENHVQADCARRFFAIYGEKIKDRVKELLPNNARAQRRDSW